VDSESSLVDCTSSATNEASEELADTMLLCSVHLSCKVSNKVTGRPNVKVSFPKSFQAIQWTVKPDESWNYQQTQVTHTLRGTDGVLSGTKVTPSMVEIQVLRGKYDDLRTIPRVEAENRYDYGMQLAWAGSTPVEPPQEEETDVVHYVSFQFDVNPLVLLITAKNIKDQMSLAVDVLTLFLSSLAGVKVVKTIFQCVIDKILLRRGRSAPKDVLRRQQLLEEISKSGVEDEVKQQQQQQVGKKQMVHPAESGSTSIEMPEENQEEVSTSEKENRVEELRRDMETLKKELVDRLAALEQKNTE
jgi:hypothetical protein